VLWSFDLLNDAERLTLARTAVFAGEFTLEDSEAICAGEGVNDVDVVDLLDSLVRKSLITAIHVGPVVRYRLFETIRQFAEEHLESLGEREAVSLRHARRYADESIRQFEVWRSPKEPEAYAWLEIAIDNLRAAFSWACEHDEVDIAATIASNVGDMARVRLRGEAAGWAGEILSRARQVEHRRLVVLLTWATSTAWSLGRLEEATRLGEEAVALIDDARFDPFAWAFTDLATVAMLQNDPERVLKWSRAGAAHPADGRDQFCRAFLGYFETMAGRGTEAMEMASLALSTVEAAGGMPTPIAIAHLSRGYAASEADLEIAISEFERSFDMARKSGNRLIEVLAATSLAALVARQGDPAVALKGLLKAIDLCLGVSDVAVIYQGLASLAVALGRTGDHLGAATVAGAIGSDVRPQAYLGLAQAIDEALASLGRAARDAATVRGQAMSRGELMDYARSRVEDALAKLAATSAVA
jgi:tetratricopeptide (TPR) repeat protein